MLKKSVEFSFKNGAKKKVLTGCVELDFLLVLFHIDLLLLYNSNIYIFCLMYF